MNKKVEFFGIGNKRQRRISEIIIMTAEHILQAVFCIFFAIGTKGVIDGAVSDDMDQFKLACVKQVGSRLEKRYLT